MPIKTMTGIKELSEKIHVPYHWVLPVVKKLHPQLFSGWEKVYMNDQQTDAVISELTRQHAPRVAEQPHLKSVETKSPTLTEMVSINALNRIFKAADIVEDGLITIEIQKLESILNSL